MFDLQIVHIDRKFYSLVPSFMLLHYLSIWKCDFMVLQVEQRFFIGFQHTGSTLQVVACFTPTLLSETNHLLTAFTFCNPFPHDKTWKQTELKAFADN